MTNSKKLIAGVLVATMALAGVLVGTISADEETDARPGAGITARVAELLGLDRGDVENAFRQAVQEQREERQAQMEAAREARLQDLIDEGVVTQEQVDAWEEWLASRPDNQDAMRAWMESRPDMGGACATERNAFGAPQGRFGERAMMPRGPMFSDRGFQGQCPQSDPLA